MSNEPGEEAPDAVMARVDMDIVRRRTVDEFICCIPTRDSQSAVWCEVFLTGAAVDESDASLLRESNQSHWCKVPIAAVAKGVTWEHALRFKCSGGFERPAPDGP